MIRTLRLSDVCLHNFSSSHRTFPTRLDEEIAGEEKADTLEADVDSSGESEDGGSGGDMEVVQVEERGMGWGRKEQWDCESILRFESCCVYISCMGYQSDSYLITLRKPMCAIH